MSFETSLISPPNSKEEQIWKNNRIKSLKNDKNIQFFAINIVYIQSNLR